VTTRITAAVIYPWVTPLNFPGGNCNVTWEITAVTTQIIAAVCYPMCNCIVTRVVNVMSYLEKNYNGYRDYCFSVLPGG